jgi:hypothetical protein
MLANYECMFRKAGITEANSAFNMWSDDRYRTNARQFSQLDAMPHVDAVGQRDPRRWRSRGHSRNR